MILPEGGEARPAPPEKHLARRGASARHFGLFPLEEGALSSAKASQLESKDRVRLRGMVDDAVDALSWKHGETHRPRPAFVDRRCETELGFFFVRKKDGNLRMICRLSAY